MTNWTSIVSPRKSPLQVQATWRINFHVVAGVSNSVNRIIMPIQSHVRAYLGDNTEQWIQWEPI